MTAPRASVAICIPSNDQWQAATSVAVIDMIRFSLANRVDCGVINWRGATVTASRNGLVKLATDIKGVDAILWVDSDMVMPPDTLLRLLDHDKDVVGCFYNKRTPPHETVGKLRDPNADISKGGLYEADYLPGGLALVKSSVYRKLAWPWYFESYRWPGDPVESFLARLRDTAVIDLPAEIAASLPGSWRAWIAENHAADVATYAGNMVSEDIAFCKKARAVGYRLYCDVSLTYQVQHLAVMPVACAAPEPR